MKSPMPFPARGGCYIHDADGLRIDTSRSAPALPPGQHREAISAAVDAAEVALDASAEDAIAEALPPIEPTAETTLSASTPRRRRRNQE